MGRKSKTTNSLGRSLIKDRFGSAKSRRRHGEPSMLHTTELDDGYEWGRLNVQSVTEQSSFQEFLSIAEQADTEFQEEKLNITFVNPLVNLGILSKEERAEIEKQHELNMNELQVPRRPAWDENTSAVELDAKEKQNFLEWRRRLAMLQETKGLLMTPYEKNLEFWRQLWRVVERSDVVVQIVDARRPLLFRCADLEAYVKEVSPNKTNLLLVNKADYLTLQQRETWAEYFSKNGIRASFFSAALAAKEQLGTIEENDEKDFKTEENDEKGFKTEENIGKVEENKETEKTEEEIPAAQADGASGIINYPHILSQNELIEFLRTFHDGPKVTEGLTTVGLVGYPNVGKSSTINTLLTEKKVSVSATPGKTKHFQTLYVTEDLMLCDCPGLVMPSFVSTRAEMVLNGILPIDQLREYSEPVGLVCQLIPRYVLEDTYGIMLPAQGEDADQSKPPGAQEFLSVYAYNRGFMTHKGIPDAPRAARLVLKDFVNGKLLHCSAPPGVDQEAFHVFPPRQKSRTVNPTPQGLKAMKAFEAKSDNLDETFFKKATIKAHTKGPIMVATGDTPGGLPGKAEKKQKNRKREKLRRVYGHLDE